MKGLGAADRAESFCTQSTVGKYILWELGGNYRRVTKGLKGFTFLGFIKSSNLFS